jgi:hypothetical protein
MSWRNFFSAMLLSVGIPLVILFTTDKSVSKPTPRSDQFSHQPLYLCACLWLLERYLDWDSAVDWLGIVSFIMPILRWSRLWTTLANPTLSLSLYFSLDLVHL